MLTPSGIRDSDSPLVKPSRLRCLLTGANGNLGRAIQRIGAFELTCVTRETWADVQANDVSEYDLVIHAAGDLQVRPGEHPSAFVDSNIRALTELLEWVGQRCRPRVFMVSSCAVYGNSLSTHESTVPCPLTANGIAKLLSEKLLHAYCDVHGIEFVAYRVFNIFGGDDRFSVLHHLRRAVMTGKPFVLNNRGRAHRDFVHVDDVAAVFSQLAKVRDLPQYLNVGTGVTTRIADVVSVFEQRFPNLKIEYRDSPESEYSRADISLLQKYATHKYQSVLEYVLNMAGDVPLSGSISRPS